MRAGAEASTVAAHPEAQAAVRDALAAGPLVIEARGVSMRPWLRPGDRVRLARRAPRRGDVVLAVVEGRLVLHRLRRHAAGRWLLRGDARPRPDGWIRNEDVLAVAVARAREHGTWRTVDAAWRRWLALGTSRMFAVARALRSAAR